MTRLDESKIELRMAMKHIRQAYELLTTQQIGDCLAKLASMPHPTDGLTPKQKAELERSKRIAAKRATMPQEAAQSQKAVMSRPARCEAAQAKPTRENRVVRKPVLPVGLTYELRDGGYGIWRARMADGSRRSFSESAHGPRKAKRLALAAMNA